MSTIKIEISGPRRSGKTTIAVPLIQKALQEAGYLVDVQEHKMSIVPRHFLNVDPNVPTFVIVDKS